MNGIVKIICIIFIFMPFIRCNSQHNTDKNFDERREIMVRQQIELRGVENQEVLSAMQKVERHKFVLPDNIEEAYDDHPLPIGYGQTISQPYIVGIMSEAIEPNKDMKILEIGTGSGYQAAVLAEICDSVFTIEVVPELGEKAKKLLNNELGYDNVFIKVGDGYLGWPDNAPFDAIIVTCAPTKIPQPLKDQLAEGGKMIIPYGEHYAQKLALLTKENGQIRQEHIIHVRFVPMVDPHGKKY